jgi:DNA-directed RNA polymerase subunit M/transcription elongation factor TFIIS
MEHKQIGSRTCPECGSAKYLFRGRKKIPATDGKAEAIETTYRCKECEHAWKERVPVKQQA